MQKKSHRIEFDKIEQETLEELKGFFNLNTKNAVIRHLIKLSKNKYLK